MIQVINEKSWLLMLLLGGILYFKEYHLFLDLSDALFYESSILLKMILAFFIVLVPIFILAIEIRIHHRLKHKGHANNWVLFRRMKDVTIQNIPLIFLTVLIILKTVIMYNVSIQEVLCSFDFWTKIIAIWMMHELFLYVYFQTTSLIEKTSGLLFSIRKNPLQQKVQTYFETIDKFVIVTITIGVFFVSASFSPVNEISWIERKYLNKELVVCNMLKENKTEMFFIPREHVSENKSLGRLKRYLTI